MRVWGVCEGGCGCVWVCMRVGGWGGEGGVCVCVWSVRVEEETCWWVLQNGCTIPYIVSTP